jgi:membrane protease YdiL (CAAX protease family)
VPVLAILVSVVPMYAALIFYHISSSQQTNSMEGFFGYLTINGSISITVIYLLQRYLLGESFRDLSLKPAKWWQDTLGVVTLVFITLVVLPYLTSFLTARLPSEDMSGLGDLFGGLAENPWLAVLFIGPVLMIGVGFEEVTRVFFLKNAWRVWPTPIAQWINVVISALVFGLAHLYQGTSGVVSTGVYGLFMAVYYRYIGRLMPMVLAHYLHDAIQFVMLIVLIRNGSIQL